MALLYSAGLLEGADASEFEAMLRTGDEECISELRAWEEIEVELALALPESRPRPHVRERLMAQVSGTVEPPPGMHIVRASEQGWSATPYPGVTSKLLYYDRSTHMFTSLLRMQPGASYPPHRHSACEQCLVIEGEVRFGDLVLHAGDYERAEAGSGHGLIESDTGCLLLLVASSRDEILA